MIHFYITVKSGWKKILFVKTFQTNKLLFQKYNFKRMVDIVRDFLLAYGTYNFGKIFYSKIILHLSIGWIDTIFLKKGQDVPVENIKIYIQYWCKLFPDIICLNAT